MVALLLAHPLLLVLGYAALTDQSYAQQFMSFMTEWDDVGKAALAVVLMLLVALSSLAVIRNRVKYESWYLIHFLTYIAILISFGHQTNSGDVSTGVALNYWLLVNGLAGALFLGYRWLRIFYLQHKHALVVEKVVHETPDIISVYVTGKNMASFPWEPGQFMNVRFIPQTYETWKDRYTFLFPHPFSVSSIPNGSTVRFSIKTLGDFTTRMTAVVTPGTPVRTSGPLGRLTQRAAQKDKYLMIGGGIGITPLRALAESLGSQGKDVTLIYSARTKADLALFTELKALPIKLVALTGDAEQADAPLIQKGMLTPELLKQLVADLCDRDVYLCGPPPMMRALSTTLAGFGVHESQIHYERFGY
jgi:predicted ferric reductase